MDVVGVEFIELGVADVPGVYNNAGFFYVIPHAKEGDAVDASAFSNVVDGVVEFAPFK